ncbi:MAG: hypothetical protein KDA45_06110 [Planctomycetales bacterium]|nr:hypothetical protein [Planctomycetales bacterium]
MPETIRASHSGQPQLSKSKIVLLSILAVVAALLTCGLLQAKHPFFTVSDDYSIGMGASTEARLALKGQQERADRLNAAVTLAVGGALLAGTLAIFAPSNCCSWPLRLLVALPWGAVWGAATGVVGVMAFATLMPTESLPSPAHIGLAQGVAFAMLGGGLGLLYGGFSRNLKTTATAAGIGAVAGALGAIAFPILAGLVMPSQSTVELVPAAALLRPLWLGLPFAAIAVALAGFCPPPGSAACSSDEPPAEEPVTSEQA